MSSIETNVGSPPIVRRTSSAWISRSTARPSERISVHCSSVYGLVTRGSSSTRVTLLSWTKVTSHSSVKPVRGAALTGSGVHASGM
jgi:hypothetical protein